MCVYSLQRAYSTNWYWYILSKNCASNSSRLLSIIPNLSEWKYPLNLEITDGLDGSGSHKIYNQLPPHPDISTKSFLLFSFKIISMTDSFHPPHHWYNPIPNSPFILRPVALLSLEENYSNVKFFMETLINRDTDNLENYGIDFEGRHIKVKIVRA